MRSNVLIYIILSLYSSSTLSCDNDIFNAIKNGNISIVQSYLSKGGNVNMQRNVDLNNCVYETGFCMPDTLLSQALITKHQNIAIELVKAGANFKKESRSFVSPIEIAIELDQVVFIKYLVENNLILDDDVINFENLLKISHDASLEFSLSKGKIGTNSHRVYSYLKTKKFKGFTM